MLNICLSLLTLALVVAVLVLLLRQKPAVATVTHHHAAPAPVAPTPTPMVRVRLLGSFDEINGEVTIPAFTRRPTLTDKGQRYHAERQGADGVWIYRIAR